MGQRLATFKVTGSAVALALFADRELEYVELRHLMVDVGRATNTLRSFLGWTLEILKPNDAVVSAAKGRDQKADRYMSFIREFLNNCGLPVREVSVDDLLNNYAIPPVRTKAQLAKVALGIWPHLRGRGLQYPMLEAAAMGLYVQTDRVLTINAKHE